MNRKTSTLLSLGISAVLIAAAIWFLYRHNAGMWVGNGRWGMGYHHMMGGGMGIIMIIFWVVLIGALVLLITGAINGIRGTQQNDDDLRKPLEILKQRYARGEIDKVSSGTQRWPTLAQFTRPAKALVSVVILTMAIAMEGALGQIIVHDIIPTFFSGQATGHLDKSEKSDQHASKESDQNSSSRGDLFSEEPIQAVIPKEKPLYQNEQFVWTLKWIHIHLLRMNMIFIFMGAVALFLKISIKTRTWLVILPFIGVFLDISAMWLKSYISPVFFWLHIPGGGLFGVVFAIVAVRAFWEMYGVRKN